MSERAEEGEEGWGWVGEETRGNGVVGVEWRWSGGRGEEGGDGKRTS